MCDSRWEFTSFVQTGSWKRRTEFLNDIERTLFHNSIFRILLNVDIYSNDQIFLPRIRGSCRITTSEAMKASYCCDSFRTNFLSLFNFLKSSTVIAGILFARASSQWRSSPKTQTVNFGFGACRRRTVPLKRLSREGSKFFKTICNSTVSVNFRFFVSWAYVKTFCAVSNKVSYNARDYLISELQKFTQENIFLVFFVLLEKLLTTSFRWNELEIDLKQI